MLEWHKTDISDLALEFGTDINVGRINVDSKRKRNGSNEIFSVPPVNSGSIIRKIASDASILLLAVTYLIAALLGLHLEALIAIPLLSISFAASCYIRYLSEKRIYSSHNMLSPRSKIIENGKKITLSALDIECGDLIYFNQGDIITADARLVWSENLYVAERFYNKHNQKVDYRRIRKDHDSVYVDNNAAEIYDNMVYAGSAVVSGSGRAIITAVGRDTRVGRTENTIQLTPENDFPHTLDSFCGFAKKFSLAVLLSLVPITVYLLYLSTTADPDGDGISILYTFLTMLAVAVTSMSELISTPALAIVTNALFGGRGDIENGITKLSSAERIADTDTMLILCPDAVTDRRNLVRRVFLSDREYRLDSLSSDELNSFLSAISLYMSDRRNAPELYERNALRRFLLGRANKSTDSVASLPSIKKVDDLDAVSECEYFRTEGDSQWKFDEDSRNRLAAHYYQYVDLGLKVSLYVSIDKDNQLAVFEGMIAIGEEYPFSDGEIFSECAEYGIAPILVLENETESSLRVAVNCGIVDREEDIVFASQLAESGTLLSDLPSIPRVYIGFGRDGTKEIVKNLTDRGRKLLPIIKSLSDKSAILPLSVYATQKDFSYESVKYTSSLSLRAADAEKHSGGVSDAVSSVKRADSLLLRLNAFQRYLTASTVCRLTVILLSLLTHGSAKPMSALMILLAGLLTDGIALLVFATSNVSQKTVFCSTKTSPTLLYAAVGGSVALISHVLTNLFINGNLITGDNSQIFVFYSLIMTQLLTLGAFLPKICKRGVNAAYISVFTAFSIYLVSQNWFSDAFYNRLEAWSLERVEVERIPLLLISGILSFVFIHLIDKLFLCFNKN